MGQCCGARDDGLGPRDGAPGTHLMKRNWKVLNAEPAECRVRVLHWNVLAQKLTDGFDKSDPRCLVWEHRRPLFDQEFNKKRGDGSLFWDVVCTAECDEHAAFFADEENPRWVGHYGAKPNSFTGGTSVFANADKFTVLDVHCEHFKDDDGSDMSQNWVALDLEDKATGAQFVVLGTHLKAKPPMAPVREQQAAQLVELVAERFAGREVIVVGDMNDTPDAVCMQTLKGSFDSAYETLLGEEPAFTTHKYRPKEGMVTRTIDYIFTQNEAAREETRAQGAWTISSLDAFYELPAEADLPEGGYPTPTYPSDHLALGVEFQFQH